MEIENVKIEPLEDNDKPHHLKPTLKVEFDISDVKPQEVILDAFGSLFINETIISKIYIDSASVKETARRKISNVGKSILLQGYAELDKESLDFIENSRDADEYKDVNFSASVTISFLERTSAGLIIGYHRIVYDLPQESTIIKSSDWVNKFAPKLGTGNFLVLEVPLDFLGGNNKLKTNAARALTNALDLISKAEQDFLAMEPGGVIYYCRKAVLGLSNFMFKFYKNNLTSDNMQKIIRLSGNYLKYMKSTDSQKEVKNGWVGLLGFLSFFHHDDNKDPDIIVDHLVLPDGYDAEAALFFTKVFVKFVAELLYKEDKKDI